MALSSREEEVEMFIDDYTNQARLVASMSDIQIKILVRKLIEEDPEWYEILRNRFKKKQLMRQAIKDVIRDPSGVIKDIARKVA